MRRHMFGAINVIPLQRTHTATFARDRPTMFRGWPIARIEGAGIRSACRTAESTIGTHCVSKIDKWTPYYRTLRVRSDLMDGALRGTALTRGRARIAACPPQRPAPRETARGSWSVCSSGVTAWSRSVAGLLAVSSEVTYNCLVVRSNLSISPAITQ
jgi:hypothetical protein